MKIWARSLESASVLRKFAAIDKYGIDCKMSCIYPTSKIGMIRVSKVVYESSSNGRKVIFSYI